MRRRQTAEGRHHRGPEGRPGCIATSLYTSSKDIAQEPEYYDTVRDDGTQTELETKYFSKRDNEAAVPLQTLRTTPDLATLHRVQSAVAHFMALQMLRGPAFRRFVLEFLDLIGSEPPILQSVPDRMGGVTRVVHAFFLNKELDQLSARLDGRPWTLWVTDPDDRLCLSENPVVAFDNTSRLVGQTIGLFTGSNSLCLPISPNLALIVHPHGARTDPHPHQASAADVLFLNQLQLYGTKQYLYGSIQDFGWARDSLKAHPDWAQTEA